MYKKTITKEEINTLPRGLFDGPMHIISNREDYLRCVDALQKEPVLGFDTETRPAFKKGTQYKISLLQLSTNKEAFLFRLNQFSLGDELKDLLADQGIVKTGVAIRDDLRGLRQLKDFQPGSFVEIADLAKKLEISQLGLRSLAGMILNMRISKKYQMTNWEKDHLTEDQLRYAATDAWVGFMLYNRMSELIKLSKD